MLGRTMSLQNLNFLRARQSCPNFSVLLLLNRFLQKVLIGAKMVEDCNPIAQRF